MKTQHLQEAYLQYAFEDPPLAGEVESEAKTRVTPYDLIFKRTYEAPFKWYLVVFSPLNVPYANDPEYFRIKGLDNCRKLFKRPMAYFMTREIQNCEKIHVNALVCTDQDLSSRNNTIYNHRYYIHIQSLPAPVDRSTALAYITKEEGTRTFIKYLDYLSYQR